MEAKRPIILQLRILTIFLLKKFCENILEHYTSIKVM